jgi:DNA (cytosine-5)-methyltransferase 1
MNELALFSGGGGGILGGLLLGWRTRCAVEIDPYARRILLARQRDGILEPFPIWDDITNFDGRPWKGNIDIVTGGFPCQDVSVGGFGAGLEGERSGLWSHMARVIREVGPRYVLVENSPVLTSRGLGTVLGDLASMGFDARWGVLGARSCGGPVERERIWIAGSNKEHGGAGLGDQQLWQSKILRGVAGECPSFWIQAPPVSFGVVDGMDSYVDQVGAIGNGQVPAVVRLAWNILTSPL